MKLNDPFIKLNFMKFMWTPKENGFLAEKYLIRICYGLAEILHRGGLVDRAGLLGAGRTERL